MKKNILMPLALVGCLALLSAMPGDTTMTRQGDTTIVNTTELGKTVRGYRGTTPLSGMGRVETVEINGTVTIDRVQVNPGDLVAADANGLCFIPAALVDEVYAELKNSNVIA